MTENRTNLTLCETLYDTVSWEECSNKEFLEKSWKSIAGQLSSREREDEIVRLKKIIWQLEERLAREAREDARKTIEQLREENQQLRLDRRSLENRISGCEPSVIDYLRGDDTGSCGVCFI